MIYILTDPKTVDQFISYQVIFSFLHIKLLNYRFYDSGLTSFEWWYKLSSGMSFGVIKNVPCYVKIIISNSNSSDRADSLTQKIKAFKQ